MLFCVGIDCVICVWKQSDGLDNGGNILALDNEPAANGHKENWNVIKMLRCECHVTMCVRHVTIM